MIAQKFTYRGFEIQEIGRYHFDVFKDRILITTCSSVFGAQCCIDEFLQK